MDSALCPICTKDITPSESFNKLTVKGVVSLLEASIKRKDAPLNASVGQKVHSQCRAIYTHPRKIEDHLKKEHEPSTSQGKRLRSKESFDFQSMCLFCVNKIEFKGSNTSSVSTLDTGDTLLEACRKRNDEWGHLVRGRIESVNDLPAADAIYHRTCYMNFTTKKSVPISQAGPAKKKAKLGRKKDLTTDKVFEELTILLENNYDTQITLYDLISKMEERLQNSSSAAYSRMYMTKRLKEHFGENIVFTNLPGKKTVITFRKKASSIIHDFYKAQRCEDSEIEKLRLIRTAAELIKADAKMISSDLTQYPDLDDICIDKGLDFLPDSLKAFLQCLIKSKNEISAKVKIASIGQCLLQAMRPVGIQAPLVLGLGVLIHHKYATQELIDLLYKMGLGPSYDNVRKFEKNAAVSQGIDIINPQGKFYQFAADNVDHQIKTLDGKNTYHGMGIVLAATPEVEIKRKIPKQNVTRQELQAIGKITILNYESNLSSSSLIFDNNFDFEKRSKSSLDLIWKCSIFFGNDSSCLRPSWSGMMQLCHKGPNPGKASTIFLPMIDLKSSDPQCVYSTLHFVASQSIKYESTPIITFDQPLAWLAWLIIANEGPESKIKEVVVRLGSFHAEMSFMGAIGHNMAGSGLEDIFEQIYASVHHIMSGHAVARANRAHILMDSVLSALLISSCLGIQVNYLQEESSGVQRTEDCELGTTDIDQQPLTPHNQFDIEESMSAHKEGDGWDLIREIEQLYKNIIETGVHCHDLENNETLQKVDICMKAFKESLKTSRTAQLWLQYMYSTEIARSLKICERTGDFLGHLYYFEQMMPILAAAGHNLYVKSISIYLKNMKALPATHPNVYNHFLSGYHIVRSSDREFSGRPMDLFIEQDLNRNLKSSGGLTHGSGFNEIQRITWLLSRNTTAYVNKKMQEFANVFQKTGEQNKDLSVARMKRDLKDMKILWNSLIDRNPFTMGEDLINIWNGQHAHANVNVDQVLKIGQKILIDMNGKSPDQYTFRKKNQAVTMASKQSLKIGQDSINISYGAMFQRLSVVAANQPDSLENALQTELCTYAPSLFESPQVLKEARKADLANTLWSMAELQPVSIPQDVQWVVDGGMLIHHIQWKKGSTFQDIFDSYVKYVSMKFPNGKIVFDGYMNPSIKDTTHIRRNKGQTAIKISFQNDMALGVTKEYFLLNLENKQRFITLLSQELEVKGFKVFHASGDADRLIVEVAMSCAEIGPTAIAADDTDIVCMSIDSKPDAAHELFVVSQQKPKKGTRKIWDIDQFKAQLPLVSKYILFLHVFFGCDTTSRIHGIGKGAPLEKFSSNLVMQECAKVFLNPDAQKEEIIQAGEKVFLILYKSKHATNLNTQRFHLFVEKVSSKMAQVDPAKLPPTSSAAKFHSLRVFLQIMMMKSSSCSLNPEDWGWRLENGIFYPIVCDNPPAPDYLLKLIKCGCKGNCSTRACTCVSNAMRCSVACENCKGSACSNAAIIDMQEEVEIVSEDEDLL